MTEPLKVLFITHNYIRHRDDFAGVFLHLLARKLKNHGVKVIVLAPHDATLGEYEIIDDIEIHRFRYADDEKETFAYRGDMHNQLLRNPLLIFRLFKFVRSAYKKALQIIKDEDIKIVSIHWVVPNGLIGQMLMRKLKDKINIYISSHGTDIRILTKIPLVLSYFKNFISRCRGWTVVSTFLRSKLSIKNNDLGNTIQVIPLPNDESIFKPIEHYRKDPGLIVAVSRLTAQKRLSYLLDAVKLAVPHFSDIRLYIYGTGPEKQKLEQKITEDGLTGQVTIYDPVAQVQLTEMYNRADLVVLNSFEEGFGLALTEAMLCKTAVIGTRSGGITDIIEHEQDGFLVPLDDAQALSHAIVRLLKDKKLRDKLAEAGYQKALKYYSSDSSAKAYAELFRQ